MSLTAPRVWSVMGSIIHSLLSIKDNDNSPAAEIKNRRQNLTLGIGDLQFGSVADVVLNAGEEPVSLGDNAGVLRVAQIRVSVEDGRGFLAG